MHLRQQLAICDKGIVSIAGAAERLSGDSAPG
jgi:hypothetical protein